MWVHVVVEESKSRRGHRWSCVQTRCCSVPRCVYLPPLVTAINLSSFAGRVLNIVKHSTMDVKAAHTSRTPRQLSGRSFANGTQKNRRQSAIGYQLYSYVLALPRHGGHADLSRNCCYSRKIELACRKLWPIPFTVCISDAPHFVGMHTAIATRPGKLHHSTVRLWVRHRRNADCCPFWQYFD